MTLPIRKPTRLKNYDYSKTGVYFVTICTENKTHCLSHIRRGGVLPLPLGQIVEQEIQQLTKQFDIQIDHYVVMPNHIHLLISIQREEQSPSPTLQAVIGALKSIITKKANILQNSPGRKLFQRSFYDHVIRDQSDYDIRYNYIDTNPLRWELDRYYQPYNQ